MDNAVNLTIGLIFISVIFILTSVVVNKFFLKNASSFGKNKGGGQIRWATAAKPPVGGMSFYATFIIATLVVLIMCLAGNLSWSNNKHLLGLIIPVTIGFAIGFIDDSYDASPFTKFVGQFFCAVCFILSGLVINITDNSIVNYWVTVVWVIGIMNSINMLDNMDGIVSCVSIVSLLVALYIMMNSNEIDYINCTFIIATIGALCGFLFFNWNPARIYMGDTGSQFLGAFLSWVSIQYFWQFRDNADSGFQIKQFLVPALAFSVSLIDTTTVTIRRLARKTSPFVGGKDHTTHHLAYLGFSDKNVVRILTMISIFSSILIIYILKLLKTNSWTFYNSLIIIVLYLALFFTLQYFYEVAKKTSKKPNPKIVPQSIENKHSSLKEVV